MHRFNFSLFGKFINLRYHIKCYPRLLHDDATHDDQHDNIFVSFNKIITVYRCTRDIDVCRILNVVDVI